MLARGPVRTLREVARTVEPGGPIATAIWAPPEQNAWFAEPRAAVAAALGPAPAAFARAFGRLGEDGRLAALHREAGLRDVEQRVLRDCVRVPDAAAHWRELARTNGHYARLARALSAVETEAVEEELARRLEWYRDGDALALPRAMVLVTATV
jgi:hypothetical protein